MWVSRGAGGGGDAPISPNKINKCRRGGGHRSANDTPLQIFFIANLKHKLVAAVAVSVPPAPRASPTVARHP
ncbi:unnamed protein product, partial [Iphiclides podalirius]